MDAWKTSGSSPGLSKENLPAQSAETLLKTQPQIDFSLENHHGSIFLLRPITAPAFEWVESHIGRGNGYQPYWPTVVIEHRYIESVLDGIQADGLVIR
jgi:hypothetical protein